MNRQEHLLSCLGEECAEVTQRVCKALRFGLSEVEPGQNLTNLERIHKELTELIAVVEMLESFGLHLPPRYSEQAYQKQKRVIEYMEYARACGALE